MATNYPTSLDDSTSLPNPSANANTNSPSHAAQHDTENDAIKALEAKVGTGASTPTANLVLRSSGTGASVWGSVNLATDVTGVLPAGNVATLNQNTTGSAAKLTTARNIDGQAFDGTANITVVAPGTHAATSKTTPVDADELPLVDSASSFVLAKLTWANLKATIKSYYDSVASTFTNKSISGSSNTLTNIGTSALSNASVTADKLATGATGGYISTSETVNSPSSYVDAPTPGPSVTVTIGANGLALVFINSGIVAPSGGYAGIGVAVSGANTIGASDDKAAFNTLPNNQRYSASLLYTGLSAGSTTFKLVYKGSSAAATYVDRRIAVVPL